MSSESKMSQLQFLKAWKSSRRKSSWTGFHEDMNKASIELGHGAISERALSVRCHAITKSLKGSGYEAPKFPKKPTNLQGIAADLGLAKIKA
jgi:hypothetical protein